MASFSIDECDSTDDVIDVSSHQSVRGSGSIMPSLQIDKHVDTKVTIGSPSHQSVGEPGGILSSLQIDECSDYENYTDESSHDSERQIYGTIPYLNIDGCADSKDLTDASCHLSLDHFDGLVSSLSIDEFADSKDVTGESYHSSIMSSFRIDECADSKACTDMSGESAAWTNDAISLSPKKNSVSSERNARSTAIRNRAYHLPGNTTWCDDFIQYLTNSHPLFTGCSDYNRSMCMRFIPVTASLLLGFIATNAVLWWTLWDESLSTVVFSQSSGENIDDEVSEQSLSIRSGGSIYITVGSLYLWTWVAFMHAMHDILIWYAPSCNGQTAMLLWVFLLLGIATVTTVTIYYSGVSLEFGVFDTLISFGVEVFVAWFLWFPLAATTLFSGVLGCFRVRILGGRAWEMSTGGNASTKDRTPVNTMSAFMEYDA
jgi:hypothetical protein